MPAKRPPLEREIQRQIIKLCEALGCTVIRFSEFRRTRVTPGVPDLKVYCPHKRVTWWHEVKAPGGVQSADQQLFQRLAEACGELYCCGGLADAERMLRGIGLIAVL